MKQQGDRVSYDEALFARYLMYEFLVSTFPRVAYSFVRAMCRAMEESSPSVVRDSPVSEERAAYALRISKIMELMTVGDRKLAVSMLPIYSRSTGLADDYLIHLWDHYHDYSEPWITDMTRKGLPLDQRGILEESVSTPSKPAG